MNAEKAQCANVYVAPAGPDSEQGYRGLLFRWRFMAPNSRRFVDWPSATHPTISRRYDPGRIGKTDGRAFLPNEPILDFSKSGAKWLIINNLTTGKRVVKKRQLKKRTHFGEPSEALKKMSEKWGQKNENGRLEQIVGLRLRRGPLPLSTHCGAGPQPNRFQSELIGFPSGLNPSQSDLIRPNPTNGEVFFAKVREMLARVLLCGLASGAALLAAQAHAAGEDSPPPVQREFRGLWVATVENIDWPSQRGLDPARQKQEMLALLDRAAALRFNVVVLQIRAGCDAFYESKIEPWSEYLTGRMGQGPAPPYDPLQFAVAEAHKRGLQLHAWFNPYRARLPNPKTPAATNHVSVKHPEWVRTYGKYLWLDPGEQGTRDYSLSVVVDVVRRYDIDGVHFDDYFYPYPEKADGQEINFPDEVPWRRYLEQGGRLTRADWRRENVNRFVQAVYQAIKKEKPWVQFGISPFGIWRPSHPAQITGLDSYDKLYCDARTWLDKGWLDYCAPQLYWPVDDHPHSFPVLLQWWASQNTRQRTLLAGMKVNGWKKVPDEAKEAAREIELTRRQEGASGEILWHARPLMTKTNRVAEALQHQIYAAPALVPALSWLGAEAPGKPLLQAGWVAGELKLRWRSSSGEVWQWVLQKKSGGHWTTEILAGDDTTETIKPGPATPWPDEVALFAVDRFGDISGGAVYHSKSPGRDSVKP
jgi:uncharacterized lipoprotein YddW (UPF0748 family)